MQDSHGNFVFGKPIIKSKVRILRADEWEALRKGATLLKNQVHLDVLLYTGMRYVEAQRLHGRPEWFDGQFVFLPAEAVLKHERKQVERWVRLPPKGKEVLPLFFQTKQLPSTQVWWSNLKRWALRVNLDPVGLSPKTTRKTWESWLMSTYPEHSNEIVLSQGHTSLTSLRHYLNMPFLAEDKERIAPWVKGFFD